MYLKKTKHSQVETSSPACNITQKKKQKKKITQIIVIYLQGEINICLPTQTQSKLSIINTEQY